jgi:hypothetical protein
MAFEAVDERRDGARAQLRSAPSRLTVIGSPTAASSARRAAASVGCSPLASVMAADSAVAWRNSSRVRAGHAGAPVLVVRGRVERRYHLASSISMCK